jgi:N-dimethylarginine dimethylaminohydrolase
MKNWDIIWMHNPRNQSFHQYPYASNFISMNVLSVNPQTVICDTLSVELRDQLDKRNIETIGVTLRHARTLGGGHHCTTLDMLRV